MKVVNFNSLSKLFFWLIMSFSFFSCAEETIKSSVNKEKLEMCLANAKKFENMHGKDEVETGVYLQKAQDYYLCAEKEGDTYAGYAAAGLSDAGVAKKLDEKEIIRLYTNSANAGNAKAAYWLSHLYCGVEQNICNHPAEAKNWIIKSINLGDAGSLLYLGDFYERGYEGTVDLNRAAACFKLANDRGADRGKYHFERVIKKINPLISVNCL